MFDASDRTNKVKLEVEIEFDDGNRQAGFLFIMPQGRLMDLLNDDRKFCPFERLDGTFTSLKKASFRSVTPVVKEN